MAGRQQYGRGPVGTSEGRIDMGRFDNVNNMSPAMRNLSDMKISEELLQPSEKQIVEAEQKINRQPSNAAASYKEDQSKIARSDVKEMERRGELLAKGVREKGKATGEELKTLGTETRHNLNLLADSYAKQAEGLASEEEKKAAEAYTRLNKGLANLDSIAANIEKLRTQGAIDSPVVQRQIAAMNAVLDKQTREGSDTIRRQMAARGFGGGSNEESLLIAKYEQDMATAKAMGAVDIEQKQIESQMAMLDMQSGLANIEIQTFSRQFEQFSANAISLRTKGIDISSALKEKGIGVEEGAKAAGIAAETELFGRAANLEYQGVKDTSEALLKIFGEEKTGERFDKDLAYRQSVTDAAAEADFWDSLIGGILTGAGAVAGLEAGGSPGALAGAKTGSEISKNLT